MRNAEKQSKPIGGELLIHSWDTKFCDHRTEAPLQLICEMIKTDNPRDLRYYQIAYDVVYSQIEKEFCRPFLRPKSPGTNI